MLKRNSVFVKHCGVKDVPLIHKILKPWSVLGSFRSWVAFHKPTTHGLEGILYYHFIYVESSSYRWQSCVRAKKLVF